MNRVLQKWEGQVISVNKNFFVARLKDLSNNSRELEVEIYNKAVCEKDLKFISEGAHFFWYIKEHAPKSVIKFRKIRWTKKQIEQAKIHAEEIRKMLDW